MDKALHLATCQKLLSQGEYGLLEDIHLLKASRLFDPDLYLSRYPSIAQAGVDPYFHYVLYGWRDGLEPSQEFSCQKYLQANPDLDGKLMSPLVHYLRYGRNEGRCITVASVTDNVYNEIRRLERENCKNEDERSEIKFVAVQDFLKKKFRDLQPIPYFMGSGNHAKRLVFVTDALGASLLGGVGTALIVASRYAVENGLGLLIVTRQQPPNAEGYREFMQMMHEKVPESLDVYSDCQRDELGRSDFKLQLYEDDIFFTTSWWSTQAVKNMCLPNPIFYIVQEVEQFFYPYCDQRLNCSLLKNEPGIRYIVNSRYLWDYFKIHYPHITRNGACFDPAFPKFLYHGKVGGGGKKKRKLFFYSRAVHQRNLYCLGLKVLDAALTRGVIDTAKWEIVFAGEPDLERIEFTDGTRPEYLGQMKWADYAEFLSTVDLTFSLMYTPHPSYPPFDTLASGGVCVTNRFANKQDSLFGANMILRDLTVDDLCEGLREGIALAEDEVRRKANYESSSLPGDWGVALRPVLDFMKGAPRA